MFRTCHMADPSHLFISSAENYVLRSTEHEALCYVLFDNLPSRPPTCLYKIRPKPHYNNTQLLWRLKLDTLKGATLRVLQLQHGYLIRIAFLNWANVGGKSIARNVYRATWNIKFGEQKYGEWLVCRRKIYANSPCICSLYNVSLTKVFAGICVQ